MQTPVLFESISNLNVPLFSQGIWHILLHLIKYFYHYCSEEGSGISSIYFSWFIRSGCLSPCYIIPKELCPNV